MKKYMRSLAGILTGIILSTALSVSGLASFYDQETDTLDGKLLFPGDSMRTETNVWIAPDMTSCELSDNIWTNTDTERAYRISLYENPELGESGLVVSPQGYVVTVTGGVSTSDDGITGTHSADIYAEEPSSEGEENQPVLVKDVASYPDGSWVHIRATGAGEGWHFGHWEFEPQIYLEDIASEELSFLMPAHGLRIKAVYAEGEQALAENAGEDASGDSSEEEPADQSTDEAEIYEGEDAVPEAEEYAAEGDYAEAEGYAAEGDYAEAEGYAAEGDYAEAEGYAAEGDYEEAEGYAAEGDYAEAEVYEENAAPEVEDYAAEGDYAEAEVYGENAAPEAEGYTAEGDYAEAEVYGENAAPEAEEYTADGNIAEAEVYGENAAPEAEEYTADGNIAEAGIYEENTAPEAEEYTAEGMGTTGPEGGSIQTFSVIVENGSGSGSYEVGDLVSIIADPQQAGTFHYWATQYDTVWFEDESAAETTFYMPAENVVVTAVFDEGAAAPEQTAEEIPAEPAAQIEEAPAVPEQAAEEMAAEPAAQIEEAAAAPEQAAEEMAAEPAAQIEEAAAEPEQAAEEMAAEPAAQIEEAAAPEQTAEEMAAEPAAQMEEAAAPEQAAEEIPAEPAAQIEEAAAPEQTAEEIPQEAASKEKAAAAEIYSIYVESGGILVNGKEADDEAEAEEGAVVSLTAAGLNDAEIEKWVITNEETGETISYEEDEEENVLFVMPAAEVSVNLRYSQILKNTVEVTGGSGSGTYEDGDEVIIEASPAPEGQRFKMWMITAGDIALEDEFSPKTGFTMGEEPVSLQAVYELIPYLLTVNSGSGGGTYHKGDVVNISADWPADGKEFSSWHSDQVTVDSADRYYASLVMPAADAAVSASYQDGPSAAYNRIDGLTQEGEYLKDTKLTFTAVGNGPDKPNPNPGDFKWVPASYQIGTVSGGWSGSDYSTSMSISAVGQYTLTVVFVKQIFDGNIWTITNQTDQKSVSFYVVNALAVQTGDTTPILPFAAAAAAALAVIAGVIIYRRRR